MFQVSHEHISAFAQDRVDAFALSMVNRLRTQFAKELVEHAIVNEQLLPIVRRAMTDGACYGVIGEMDLELYVDCIALFGPGFDQNATYPWLGETLHRKDLDGTGKMDLIHDYLIFASEKAR